MSHRPVRCAAVVALSALAFLTSPAGADSPAARGTAAAHADAKSSFEGFAAAWMKRVQLRAERHREHPMRQEGQAGPIYSYRGYGHGFETDLQPTGRASSPWIGVLHYTEHVYTCNDLQAADCRVASSAPVTEVFRYRDGRWVY